MDGMGKRRENARPAGTWARTKLGSFSALAAAVVVAVGAACGGSTGPTIFLDAKARDAGTGGDAVADLPSALCVDGKPTAPYPPGPYELGVLGTVPPGIQFQGLDGPVSLDGFYEPCATRGRLLIVRASAAWCGPCRWHATHTKRWLESPNVRDRLILVDLLVRDEDNNPATPSALTRWKSILESPPTALALDPGYTLGPALLAASPLPEYVLIDTRTMKIAGTLGDPDPTLLQGKITRALDEIDGKEPSLPASPPLYDGLFENERDLVREMKLSAAPLPPDPTNEYADVAAAAALGQTLFFDKALSPSGEVACVTCHDPSKGFTDRKPQSVGTARGDRNAPSIALAAYARWQLWDGRADTLWMQALGPIEDPKEMASSRVYVVRQILTRYAGAYAQAFGSKYPLPALASLPASGKPGDPAFDALTPTLRDSVTRAFVNVGKAMAAFERTLRVKPNALDRYAEGDTSALTPPQKHGLAAFLRSGCVQCHWGPRLTNDAFHTLRFGTGRADGMPDRGRTDGLARLTQSEFHAGTKWSDAPAAAKPFPLDSPAMLGAFKTPTLRGVFGTAPYGHGGTLPDLAGVSKHYGNRGLPPEDPAAIGGTEPWVPRFDEHVGAALPAFLELLTADPVDPE
jgi:cytochrome c peroxidase